MKAVTFAIIMTMFTALAGCGTSQYAEEPLYATGYSDGCGTGSGFNPSDPSTLIRNADAWGTNKAYRAGWKTGFNACRVSRGGQTTDLPADAHGRRNGPSGY